MLEPGNPVKTPMGFNIGRVMKPTLDFKNFYIGLHNIQYVGLSPFPVIPSNSDHQDYYIFSRESL